MSTRLEPLNLLDFTGGYVARRSQFTLADNESPDLLNIEIDPRSGFYTRAGWERWNEEDITDPADWDPRHGEMHPLSSGSFECYVSNPTPGVGLTGTVWAAGPDAVFEDLAIPCSGAPHMADFASWGDVMYFACGRNSPNGYRREADLTVLALDDAADHYSDYTAPVDNCFPLAEFCETHAGYMFVANLEDGVTHPNRLRWSHPNRPSAYAEADFIDIDRGGSRITGLLSYRDHLLIFKTDSIWALFGYDSESWQLYQVSMAVGAPGVTAITRSDSAVYFYSVSDRNGIYAYAGDMPVQISERLRTFLEPVTEIDQVHLGWLGKRLWCVVPVQITRPSRPPVLREGSNVTPNVALIFDPTIGEGAWTRFAAAHGSIGPLIQRSDVDAEFPMAAMRGDTGAAVVVRLDYRDDAADRILPHYDTVLIDPDGNQIVDPSGNLIIDATTSLGEAGPFVAWYRTGWKHAGWPERRKSWLRARFIANIPKKPVAVRADVFWDYNEADARRSGTVLIDSTGGTVWGDPGLTWGQEGLTWGSATRGGTLRRTRTNFGVCRAIQIEVSSGRETPGVAWGIDGLICKVNMRQFTT